MKELLDLSGIRMKLATLDLPVPASHAEGRFSGYVAHTEVPRPCNRKLDSPACRQKVLKLSANGPKRAWLTGLSETVRDNSPLYDFSNV